MRKASEVDPMWTISSPGGAIRWTWGTTSCWRMRRVMSEKEDRLAVEEHRAKWAERNLARGGALAGARPYTTVPPRQGPHVTVTTIRDLFLDRGRFLAPPR